MKRTVLGLVIACLFAGLGTRAQGTPAFKLGTFERNGQTLVGVVLRDAVVIDIAQALRLRPGKAAAVIVPPPTDMKDLIARYDSGLRASIAEIIAEVEKAGASRPAYVFDLEQLRVRPPIMYPQTMLNVAVNYREHAQEMAGGQAPASGAPPPGSAPAGTTSIGGIWERKAADQRWNPYMFIKLPSAVIASEESIKLPRGRTQIDWECELGVVIGRQVNSVPIDKARDAIFGYTLENDVSDRGGRGDNRHGGDWLIGKSHDTFAPMGPFIVPKEFVADPQKLGVTFTLNGKVMQDANTSLMIHSVFEQVSYASHIATLRAGDVIATGSPAGVGSARKPPIFLKAGDVAACSYEGIGTLRNSVAGPD